MKKSVVNILFLLQINSQNQFNEERNDAVSIIKKLFKNEENNVNSVCEQEGDGHPIPIELLYRIDLIAVGKDGSVELRIISSGYLDDSYYTEKRILDKLNNYLSFINDDEFTEKFGAPFSEKVSIVLSCNIKPHPYVLELIESIKEQVISYNASISIEYKK